MYCPNCGNEVRENAKFCPKCGTLISKQAVQEFKGKPPEIILPPEPVKAQSVETTIQTKPNASKSAVYMIIAAALVLMIAIGSISYAVFGSSPEYREAVTMMKSGLYSEAATAFAALDPNYKDVDDKLAECKAMISYQQATDLMNSGSYTEAANIFISLGNFKDSPQLAQTCTDEATYQEAVACMNSGDYETAKIKLTALGSFKDSKTLLGDCEKGIRYNQATVLLQKGECDQAKTIFLSLGNFKDSAQMAENCNQSGAYDRAKALYDKGDYEGAKTAFTALGDYSDAKAMSVKCQNYIDYNKAVDLMKSGDKAEAEKIFTSLGSFKDSKNLALDCRYSDDYEKAQTFIQQGNLTEAAKLLETPASVNYKDSKTLLSDCKKDPATSSQNNNEYDAAKQSIYDQAVTAFKNAKYYTAYKLFLSISNYKDALEYSKRCIQDKPYTDCIYSNGSYYAFNKGGILSIKSSYNGYTYIVIYDGSTLVYKIILDAKSPIQNINLKMGKYTVKVAYGMTWFGTKELLGDEAKYFILVFNDGSQTFNLSKSYSLSLGSDSSENYSSLKISRSDLQ